MRASASNRRAAMAAKVTERLWKISDIVNVLEAWETSRHKDAA
jgi:hypothetical protein